MREAYAILDLQFGSTGKGLLAGYLARTRHPDGVVCAFGPNAGHTFVDGTGRKFVHIMMPMGALSPSIKTVFIGPGAVVHPELLMSENEVLRSLGYQYELVIHEAAAVVAERHREQEAELGKIGSTQKGTGAAAAERIRRAGGNINARTALWDTPLGGYIVSVAEYNDRLDAVNLLQIEGAQGFSLGIGSGFYPYCTYRECHLAQLLSDCGVPFRPLSSDRLRIESYGVARTYPIRVNNKTGSSGGCYHDQAETSWERIGQAPELTTVTKLQRRVFTFSMEQIRQAVRMDGTDAIFLNFCNYNEQVAMAIASRIEHELKVPVRWEGYGPSETDIVEKK